MRVLVLSHREAAAQSAVAAAQAGGLGTEIEL